MQHVFVVDATRRPLMPCRPARARRLLSQHRAAVLRQFPFTIMLLSARPEAVVTPLRLKIDPGSRTTGLTLVRERERSGEVVWAAELSHRGQEVHQALVDRHAVRRARRQRHTRHRAARFANRTRPRGWLPPSLASRVQNVVAWVERLVHWCPIAAISLEAVRFDTQLLQNPDIAGIDYQHGTLAGTEIREYLLLKWGYRCAYCHQEATATNPWEIDHIDPTTRGGSDRASNLALSCHDCNQAKGNRTAQEFGHPEVQALAKAPLRDAAAVNSTRRALHQRLLAFGLPVETASGGRTKWNRVQRRLPKTHWLDALCVGASTPERIQGWRDVVPLAIKAQRWQRRQMCLVTKHGFPRTKAKAASHAFGFRTGDIVKAVVPSGTPQGTHVGKVAIKASGYFTITTRERAVPDVPHRYCRLLHRADGYTYRKGVRAFLPIP
jgi:5-methylcytosine-specific restriction endonuclease McrA